MKYTKILLVTLGSLLLVACRLESAPKGFLIDYPYFITKDSLLIKKIKVPKGTKLVYKESTSSHGEQTELQDENQLRTIEIPANARVEWGGVPVRMIDLYANPEMRGFTVYASFDMITEAKKKDSEFLRLWERCDEKLSVSVKDLDDWSFNTQNIVDIDHCGLYQRYFKEDKLQQMALDSLVLEMRKAGDQSLGK